MVSTGDIKDKKYEVIGVVATIVNDLETVEVETASCGGKQKTSTIVATDANAMYNKGADELLVLAKAKGGNAVVYANFDYRIALTVTGEAAMQTKELFCYGTAVKLAG